MSFNFEEFYNDFLSDEEAEELLDSFVEYIESLIDPEAESVDILNVPRMEQFRFTYEVMKYLTRGTKAKVTYKLHEPYNRMGHVDVEGKLLEFYKPEWFARAAEFASNTEVYPLAKNKVRLTFTFHGLTVPLS